VVDVLSRMYVLLSTLDARFLGFEHIKELYRDDSDFANVYNACKNSAFGSFIDLMDIYFKRVICVSIKFYG
jgi:hypothetical protein